MPFEGVAVERLRYCTMPAQRQPKKTRLRRPLDD
jgi:hypothetical protein